MPRKKKLTPALKEKIKSEYKKLNKSDFTGEALHYLNRVKGAAKARATKKRYTFKVGKDITIDKRSGLYEFVSKGAENKNQTVAEFAKQNKGQIQEMLKSGYTHVYDSHADKLEKQLEDLKKSKKIYNKGVAVSKVKLMSYLSMLQSSAAEAGLYDFIPIEVGYDLKGNMHVDLPTTEELLELDKESLTEYLDENYPNIKYHKK